MTSNRKMQVVRFDCAEGNCRYPKCENEATTTVIVKTEGVEYGNAGYCDLHASRSDMDHIHQNW